MYSSVHPAAVVTLGEGAESGRLDDFPAVTLARIGQTLGVSLAYLFGLDLLS